MITTDKNELRIDRRGVSAIAENLQKSLGISRSAAIDAIAKAAGYAAGNALMGTLKNAEASPDAPSDGGERVGWRYDLTFSVLSAEKLEDGMSMEDVLAEATDGYLLGQWCEPKRVETPMSYEQLKTAASSMEFQSDVSFFMLDDEGEEPEEDKEHRP